METYDRVAKVVGPKKLKLAEAEGEYGEVMEKLAGKRAELQKVLDEMSELERQLKECQDKGVRLKNEYDDCNVKLARAETLIAGLGGERDRGSQAAEILGHQYLNLTGDVLMAAGVIAYLGAFTKAYREDILVEWTQQLADLNVQRSDQFSMIKVLGDPGENTNIMNNHLTNDSNKRCSATR